MKKLHIKGDPGQNNTYTEVNIENGSHNPSALVVVNNYIIGGKEHFQLSADYEHILQKTRGVRLASLFTVVFRILGLHFTLIPY